MVKCSTENCPNDTAMVLCMGPYGSEHFEDIETFLSFGPVLCLQFETTILIYVDVSKLKSNNKGYIGGRRLLTFS